MLYLYATIVTLLNLVWLFLTVLSLPGNWLMVLTAAVAAWLLAVEGIPGMFGYPVLIAAVVLATIGEILEFLLGAAGARKAGGSKRAAAASIVGAIVGGIVATPLVPIPLVGTLIGVCAGAFAGAFGVELLIGKPMEASLASGKGAAVGRLWGTLAKLAVGVIIFIMLTADAFF